MHAVKEKDDRNPFARIVEMIAAEEEAIRIVWIIVLRIVSKIQKRFIYVLT